MGKRKALAIALAAVALVFSLACLAGCSGEGDSSEAGSGEGTLRVGVRADVVNFGYLNEQTGKYYGLEVDIAEEMASRMGYADVEFVTVKPDDRKEMLQDGQVDCLVACYSISDSRLENFDFSPVYYSDASVVMVEKSTLITDVEQLSGKTVGIMAGSNAGPTFAIKMNELGIIGDDVVENTDEYTQYQGILVKKIPSYQELSQALEEGTVDAAVMDGAIAQTYMGADRSLLETPIAEQQYGVATQKDSALSQPVAEAIQGMLDDGTIAALTDKWN